MDVRTPQEYAGGHVAGSINIPLPQIPAHTEELKAMGGHLILCCASGARSGQAASYLGEQGISCENGGGWLAVNARMANRRED